MEGRRKGREVLRAGLGFFLSSRGGPACAPPLSHSRDGACAAYIRHLFTPASARICWHAFLGQAGPFSTAPRAQGRAHTHNKNTRPLARPPLIDLLLPRPTHPAHPTPPSLSRTFSMASLQTASPSQGCSKMPASTTSAGGPASHEPRPPPKPPPRPPKPRPPPSRPPPRPPKPPRPPPRKPPRPPPRCMVWASVCVCVCRGVRKVAPGRREGEKREVARTVHLREWAQRKNGPSSRRPSNP